MLFDIRIYEHWIDNPGNEAGGIKDIHLFADPYDKRDYYAYSLFVELVNEKDGLWKKKKFVESDGCWGEVIVKKSDLDYYFDEVHKRYFGVDELKDLMEIDEEGIYITEKKKMIVLDDKKKYRLEAIES